MLFHNASIPPSYYRGRIKVEFKSIHLDLGMSRAKVAIVIVKATDKVRKKKVRKLNFSVSQ